jgi:hypothetical protein
MFDFLEQGTMQELKKILDEEILQTIVKDFYIYKK